MRYKEEKQSFQAETAAVEEFSVDKVNNDDR